MKLAREHLYEIFTQDSDPIKDMSIGYNTDFQKIAEKTIRNKKLGKGGCDKWYGYLETFENKTISGMFRKTQNFMDKKTEPKFYEFVIDKFKSYTNGTTVNFITVNNVQYMTVKGEKYRVS